MAAFQTENITPYMNVIEKIPLISVQREVELHNLMKDPVTRDNAREELITSNLRLVVKIAHDFKHYGVTFADLVAEGNVGLMIAADKFDPGKGAKFSCYAAWWIKQCMRKAVVSQSRTIRIPQGCAQKLLHLEKAKTLFAKENNREATLEELSQMTGLSERTLESLEKSAVTTYSMDEVVKDGSDTTFGEMIPEEVVDERENAQHEEQRAQMLKAISTLSDIRQEALSRRYGLNHDVCELEDIAQELGMSTHAVQCLIDESIQQLKETLNPCQQSHSDPEPSHQCVLESA